MNIKNIGNDVKQLLTVLDNLKTKYDEDNLDTLLSTVIVSFYNKQNAGEKRLSRLHELLDIKTKLNTHEREVEDVIKDAVKEAICIGGIAETIPELQYAAMALTKTLVSTLIETEQFETAEKVKQAFKESSEALVNTLESDQSETIH